MDDREKMKAFAIMQKTISFAARLVNLQQHDITGAFTFHARLQHEITINQMMATPAKLFRKDKPYLDKRRVRRYQGKVKIIRLNK